MREIKFRAWSIAGKQMIGWEKMKEDRKTLYKYFEWADVYHLMQYTGLKDKNGVEIYEGDIILFNPTLLPTKSIVEFRYGGFWAVRVGKAHEDLNLPLVQVNNVSEVIGNIHENPELLEGKQ